MRRIAICTLAGLSLAASACGGGGGGGSTPNEKAATPEPRKLTRAELIERTRPKVAKVFAETELGKTSGTAVVLDAEEGLLLSNNHVVAGQGQLQVKFTGGGEKIPARVVGSSLSPDLAVLKLDTIPAGLQAITFAETSSVEVGADVMAIGYEGNLRSWDSARARASFGTVNDTGIRKADLGPEIAPQRGLLMTDAAVNPGSSGGVLVNDDGEAIGVITLQGGGENQGYAIEADVVREALPALKAGEHAAGGLEVIPIGSVPMAEITAELYGDQVPAAVARDFGRALMRDGGLFVLSVEAGSSADHRGFRFGDVIKSVNGLDVNNLTKFSRVLDSSTVIKTEGYRLSDEAIDPMQDFTRRVKVQ